MTAFDSTLTAFILMLIAGGSGVLLARQLPEEYLSEHAMKNLRIGMALVGTMSSLLLGLMINSSRYNYSEAYSDVQKYAAAIQVTDLELLSFGDKACAVRKELRGYVEQLIKGTWHDDVSAVGEGTAPDTSLAALLHFYGEVRQLKAVNDDQRQAQSSLLSLTRQLMEYHWKVSGVARTVNPTAFIVVVISWFCLIFLYLGVYAPRNPVVFVGQVLAMAAISGAIFLVKEMGEPFQGPVRVSPAPLQLLVDQMAAKACPDPRAASDVDAR
ncbi:DUF4239 domain-containing protein [Hyphomicrobium sp. D-2]|uniref:bestrophin-like domain n=1 Tax=Hyphomicrobium sp. D-2 TaxID=3041621 RepID=UPI00245787BB|nr:DUF4239 domain-containing protein [Hyphomicrobium sp. D-2]MDH4981582.1 DUF4239 domain-containing protein [Hyphomicrobium sp. D-2]